MEGKRNSRISRNVWCALECGLRRSVLEGKLPTAERGLQCQVGEIENEREPCRAGRQKAEKKYERIVTNLIEAAGGLS